VKVGDGAFFGLIPAYASPAETRLLTMPQKILGATSVANSVPTGRSYPKKARAPRSRKLRIAVAVERQGDEAIITVRDSGMGIAPDMLTRVFDLFTQADRALDRAQGGLGVGLTVARRLVELHGGRIEARSGGLGKGAEFVVRLPALPAAPENAPPAPRAEPEHQGRARVLLVEDHPDAARLADASGGAGTPCPRGP
jgi:hypothetical protein